MSASFIVILALSIVSLNGLLKPQRASKSSNKHYNKDAIKSHITKTKLEHSHSRMYKASIASLSSSSTEDITTATPEMWASCHKHSFTQYLDHFGDGIGPDSVTTFDQRYYVCGQDLFQWQPGNPVFFYFGNEADVTAYIDYTGFMWEQASNFNALLVFAEHRYYGESLPYTQQDIIDDTQKLKYLTTDQALHDYAVLIDDLQRNHFGYSTHLTHDTVSSSPIIGFGGSYGGMLAAWFRMKYPQYVDGVISGSSPIWGVFGLIPETDPYAFAAMETRDASSEVGVDNGLCQSNIEQGWNDMMELAGTTEGRSQLKDIFNLCNVPTNEDDASVVLDIVEESISYMSMSSYPYASNYISGAVLGKTDGALPAYPMTYACNQYLTQTFDTSIDRVTAIGAFNAVFWNSDGSNTCIDPETLWDTYNNYIWDYLYCRSLLMPSGSKGNGEDMLWDAQWNAEDTMAWCNEEYDIVVDTMGPASRKYGGREIYKSMTNIVFSNGDMDPWMPGGVLTTQSESLESIMIANAGHHLDLMFSNSADPQSVQDARNEEVEWIEQWIMQANSKWNMGMCDALNEDVALSSHPWVSAMNMLL
eukprot:206986_1